MRKVVLVLAAAVVGSLLVSVGAGVAEAHQCSGKGKKRHCHETKVYEDWRPNYVPLFDLPDREQQGEGTRGEKQRKDAQRWREECADDDQERQQCAWYYGGTSATQYDTDEEGPRPNEVHVGYAANHCFLAEAAHDCDHHDSDEFGTHDPHGGAIYADLCASKNPDSKYCNDGPTDTQVGVTVVDHLGCPFGCMDEYHVVRPLDQRYTERQMADSQRAVERIASDPQRHVCGYEAHSSC